jgi:outer membrane protein OmpA-like peptidoglycan-associated protein
MRRETLLAIIAVALGSAGCATEQQTQTAIGTGVGAAAGAVVGGAVGGSARGTAIGALVGAGVGAAAGYNWPLVKEKLGIATKGSALKVTEQKDGALKVNVPGAVSFTSGSATLSPAVYPTLDKIATTLNEYPQTTVNVVGHADSSGSMEANRELARRRAAAVGDYLAQRGVARDRITIESRGELEPIAENVTEAGRAQNRRVELLIREVGA